MLYKPCCIKQDKRGPSVIKLLKFIKIGIFTEISDRFHIKFRSCLTSMNSLKKC